MSIIDLVADFSSLFKGNSSAHGVHEYGEIDERGKRSGRSYTKNETLQARLYEEHLIGKTGLGIVPITEEGTVNFAVLDIDEYKADLSGIRKAIVQSGLPLNIFRSKSGGMHVYAFFEEPAPAKDVIPVFEQLSAIFGVYGCEIFPKQKNLKAGQIGNWINLPYYNMGSLGQCLLDAEGNPVDIDSALDHLKNSRTSIENIKTELGLLPLHDAPPCLQALTLRGGPDGFRNNYLFNLGIYLKSAYPDEWQGKVHAANAVIEDPLSDKEIQATVIQSLAKNEYTYRCGESPCRDICAKAVCKTRTYGVEQGFISSINFEQLKQVKTDPPYYTWVVNGVEMQFDSEREIIMQDKFRHLCMRHMHKIPAMIKAGKWVSIINQALSTMIVEEPESDDMSPGARLRGYVEEYLTHSAATVDARSLSMGRVWKDDAHNRFVFLGKYLLEFIHITKGFREFEGRQIMRYIKQGMEASPGREWVGTKQHRVWYIPYSALGIDDSGEIAEADFSDYKEDEEEWS